MWSRRRPERSSRRRDDAVELERLEKQSGRGEYNYLGPPQPGGTAIGPTAGYDRKPAWVFGQPEATLLAIDVTMLFRYRPGVITLTL